MILYPTETLYALGVNALDFDALLKLHELKERDLSKVGSWLVRDMDDVRYYAEVTPMVEKIAAHFLPGSLTLVLKAKDTVPDFRRKYSNEVSFRISSDPIAQTLIEEFMKENDAPLTCTSANVSGAPTLPTVGEIQQQFGKNFPMITKIIDDGPRKGLASTIVKVIDDEVVILREGDITEKQIKEILKV